MKSATAEVPAFWLPITKTFGNGTVSRFDKQGEVDQSDDDGRESRMMWMNERAAKTAHSNNLEVFFFISSCAMLCPILLDLKVGFMSIMLVN
jgi:hypothetical protein